MLVQHDGEGRTVGGPNQRNQGIARQAGSWIEPLRMGIGGQFSEERGDAERIVGRDGRHDVAFRVGKAADADALRAEKRRLAVMPQIAPLSPRRARDRMREGNSGQDQRAARLMKGAHGGKGFVRVGVAVGKHERRERRGVEALRIRQGLRSQRLRLTPRRADAGRVRAERSANSRQNRESPAQRRPRHAALLKLPARILPHGYNQRCEAERSNAQDPDTNFFMVRRLFPFENTMSGTLALVGLERDHYTSKHFG